MNPLVKAIDANLRVLELERENEKLREALEAVEWEGNERHCPWCWGYQHNGHKPDCARQAALNPREGEDNV